MEKQASSNMKLEDLPNVLTGKILCHVPIEDIFTSTQYINKKFHKVCEKHTRPNKIEVKKLRFLDSNQLRQLIKNSSALTSFHYKTSFRPQNGNILDFLATHVKSLKKFSLDNYYCMEEELCLFQLLKSDNKFTEFSLKGIPFAGIVERIDQCRDFPSLRLTTKLSLTCCTGMTLNTIINMVNACSHLTHLDFLCLELDVRKAAMKYVIRERGSQLVYLCYNVHDDEESLKDLMKCVKLRTLHLRHVDLKNLNVKFPILPQVWKFTLEDPSVPHSIYANILESFPNLNEFELLIHGRRRTRTIFKFCNLRKLVLNVMYDKKEMLNIFRRYKSIRYADILQFNLAELTKDEVIECFSSMRTLRSIACNHEDFSVAKRIAAWLPETKIYICKTCTDKPHSLLTRIRPEQCPIWDRINYRDQ